MLYVYLIVQYSLFKLFFFAKFQITITVLSCIVSFMLLGAAGVAFYFWNVNATQAAKDPESQEHRRGGRDRREGRQGRGRDRRNSPERRDTDTTNR